MQRGHAPFETVSSPLLRVQQKFNSPKFPLLPKNHPPTPSLHKKSLPMLPRVNHGPIPGFFGQTRANLGQNRAIWGRFRAFPGQNRADLAPISPSQESSSAPGDVQKIHLPARARKHGPSIPISQSCTKYRVFITFTSKNIPLSL